MTWNQCKSSNVSEYVYDPSTKTLKVRFTGGGEYHYSNVSPEKHQDFLDAESKGKFLNTHVKPHHECKKHGIESKHE